VFVTLSTVSRNCESDVYSVEEVCVVDCGNACVNEKEKRMIEIEAMLKWCMTAWVSGVYCGTLEVLN